MFEVTLENAADYLRSTSRAERKELIEIRELPGGVSNLVLLVTLPERGERLVLKQARGRLRVEQEWLCSVERIWREVEVLRICGEVLEAIADEPIMPAVPRLLWQDRENYLYAMKAAPSGNQTWKGLLLAGNLQQSLDIARACGRMLGQLHATTWQNAAIAERFEDRTYFQVLRIDPYYRQIARIHHDLAPQLTALIESVWQHRRCLVHGDFSPKNLLVSPGQVMLIDFEVGHYGDPAFDLGFFLTHLVLKSVWSGARQTEYLQLVEDFWNVYRARLTEGVGVAEITALESRLVLNLAGCMLARVDGKSRVEYLSPAQQEVVRRVARKWLLTPTEQLDVAIESLSTEY
jgi:5-methylthioribose kinase